MIPKLTRPRSTALIAVFLCVSLFLIFKNDLVSKAGSNSTAALVPAITATNNDALVLDADGDGIADPGDTIEYTVVINNTAPAGAGNDAAGVIFTDTLDANLTLVPGSVSSSPIAGSDTFSVTGNVRIQVPDGSADLLANDLDPDTGNNAGLTASGPATSTQGGSLTINANGGFSYNPPAGFEGTDSFTYTVTDASGATGTASVTLNVSGMIWFVNASAAPGGDGRLTAPFNCLTGAGCYSASATGAGDNVFLYAGAYTGGLTLLNNQKVLGQGAGAPLATIAGLTLAANSDALPSTGGARPSVTTSASNTNAFTLASNNTLRGFDIGNTTAADIAGAGVGAFTASEMTLGGTGRALDINGGTLNATFDSIASTSSSSQGIALQAVAGNLTATSGTAISGAATQGILVSGSTANINFGNTTIAATTNGVSLQNNSGGTRTFGSLQITNGGATAILHAVGGGATAVTGTATITNPGASCIDIQDSTTTVAFANVSCTQSGSTGVFLDDNSGAVTFADLDITPDAGQRGIQATAGITGTITTTSGTISTTNNAAVDIVGTSAASRTPLNMQLTSVSANGGSNGIVLTNTSSSGSPGGFLILGSSNGNCGGVANPAGSPTAPNAADCTGGVIQNTSGADGATSGNGIYLNNVQNVSLTRVKINDHSNNGIYGIGVRGLTIANSLFNGLNGTSNSGVFDESALSMVNIGGAVSVTNSYIGGGAFNNALFENNTGTAPALTLNLSGNTSGTMQGSTADIRSTAFLVNVMDGTLDADIQNNRLTVWWGNAIHVLVQGTASGSSNITGNFADNTNGALAGAGGIWVAGGTHTYNISGNTVRHTNGTAISADRANFGSTMQGTINGNTIGVSGDANSGTATGIGIFASHHGPGTTIVKISNNILRQINGSANGAITTQTGDALAFGGNGTMNATITGNNIQESGTTVNNAQHGILITHGMQSGPPNDTDQGCYDIFSNTIINFTSGTANNRLRVNQRFGTTSRFPGYTGAATGVTSQTDLASYLLARNTASTSTNANTSTGGFNNTIPAGSSCSQPASPLAPPTETPETAFSAQNLLNLPESSKNENAFREITFRPSFESEENFSFLIEPYAETKADSAERAALGNEEFAAAENAASVIAGRAETSYWRTAGAFFAEFSGKIGAAISPTVEAQETTKENTAVNLSGETITVGAPGGFSLPAAKTVTIKFRAVVNAQPPVFTQVSNQGTVSGANFANVLTDDPSIGGGADATVTIIDTTIVALTSSQNPSIVGQSVTLTATLTGAPVHAAGNPVGTVQFFDGATPLGAPVAVTAGAVNSGTAVLTIDDLTAGSHTITAEYSGGGQFNAGTGSLTGNPQIVSNTAIWDGSQDANWNTAANWATNFAPLAGNDVSIPTAGVANNPTISTSDVTIGSLTENSGRILTVGAGRSLTVANACTIDGTLTIAGAFSCGTFTGSGTVIFTGAAAQNIPALTYGNLTINNAAGVNLAGDTTVTGALTLTSGNLDAGVNKLILGASAIVSRTSGHVIGSLQKDYGATGSFTYPVGTATAYSPVAVNITNLAINPSSLTVKANDGTAPSAPALDDARTLDRFWTLTETGDLTADVTFSYLQTDVDGTETNYKTIRVAGGVPVALSNGAPCPGAGSPCVDPAANTIFVGGLSSFSDWTAGEVSPTASNVEVSGRVLTAGGRGLFGAEVTMIDQNGAVRTARTNSFGYYRFDAVAVGAGYTFSVRHKQYEFASRFVTLDDGAGEIVFVALPK